MKLKRCYKCSLSKPHSEFYTDNSRKDKLTNRCKKCERSHYREMRAKHEDKYKIREKRYYKENKKKFEIKSKEWRKNPKNKIKQKAHYLVKQALKNGIIKRKPCCVCKSKESIAHHEDYTKPLKVIWYCQMHHMRRHSEAT